MSITLEDTQGQTVHVNAWNWGVLHHAVASAAPPVFDDPDLLERLRTGGLTLTPDEADRLRAYLTAAVLPLLKPGQRLLADFRVTDQPDDGTFHRDDLSKNYSLHHDVLASVLRFLADAHPPIEVS